MDINIGLLKDILQVLDKQLETLEQEAAECPDPDSFGIFDQGESTIGLGFAACQQYIAATYGRLRIPKENAIRVGPRHQSGMYTAEVVNHAANFWKHHDEWHIEGKPNKKVVSAIEKLGFQVTDCYLLTSVLASTVNPEPCRFAPVISLLKIWRDALLVVADELRTPHAQMNVDASNGVVVEEDSVK
jgi:hypothetical protein